MEPRTPPVASQPAVAANAYVPPDQTTIEDKQESLDYWARTLETTPERVSEAIRKSGPLVEDVKKDLGSYGVG